MKKLLVKAELIDIPYSPAIEAVEAVEYQPQKWVKGEEVLFEEPSDLTDYIYHPAIEAVEGVEGKEEQPEVKSIHVIDQTQGEDDELATWLAGNLHKYPEGFFLEYIDLTAQVEQEKINQEALNYLASTDWLIIREVDSGVPCPQEIKALREEARSKIVK